MKKILFDLDGTLTDPEEGITKAVQYALHTYGIEVADRSVLYPFIGPPLSESFEKFYGFSHEQALEAVGRYREYFAPKGKFENKLYDGIDVMLKKLRESGAVCAIASSKPTVFVEDILDFFHIKEYFQVIVGSELDGRRSKKEEVVEEALRGLAEYSGPTLMVGDRRFDVEGAKEHGLISVAVTYGYAPEGELEAAGADYLVDTVLQLTDLLLNGEFE